MTKTFNIAIILQVICALTYLAHINIHQGLGSDFMFGVLLFSITISFYLLWQIFKVGNIVGTQKIIGLICVSFPFLFLLSFLSYFL
jgi:hypothetical protein